MYLAFDKNHKLKLQAQFFFRKTLINEKAARKMLVKLTPGCQ